MKQQSNAARFDSYKGSHYLQKPPGAKKGYSYIEPRGGEFEHVVMAGFQMLLNEYLSKPLSIDDVDKASRRAKLHVGYYPTEQMRTIAEKHVGNLPLLIRAIPEGTIVPTRLPLVTLTNTDDDGFAFLPQFIETQAVRGTWFPVTVASLCYAIKLEIARFMMETDGHLEDLDYRFHNFGPRGASSAESAEISGAAHLMVFKGSDCFEALDPLERHYGVNPEEDMPFFNIPAAEHSTITPWGRDREVDAYRNMLETFAIGKPGAKVAVVSDTYDLYGAVENLWGGTLREMVRSLEPINATLVIRPDSGIPREVVVKVLTLLGDRFGCSLNAKGYKVLPPYLKVIQGDGVNRQSIRGILQATKDAGWAASNLYFGCGQGITQEPNRDWMKFAQKESAVFIDGEWRDSYKEPVTDGGKASKRGRVETFIDPRDGNYCCNTIEVAEKYGKIPVMEDVFLNGEVLSKPTLAGIRKNINDQLMKDLAMNR